MEPQMNTDGHGWTRMEADLSAEALPPSPKAMAARGEGGCSILVALADC